MKRLAFLLALALCIVPKVSAETSYVSDLVRVTLRSGPGVDYRVIEMVGTGQKVEILESGPDWTKIQMPEGKEGWILTRHLTTDPPSVLLVESLRKENERQKEKLGELSSTGARVSEDFKILKKELETSQKELSTLKTEHEALKKGASEYLELKAKFDKASADLAETSQRAETYEKDLNRLQFHQNIRWFLSGAGVLIVGFLIGFSSKRQKRRSSLL